MPEAGINTKVTRTFAFFRRSLPRAALARCPRTVLNSRDCMDRHGGMDSHDSADCLHGIVAVLLYALDILPAVMKSIMVATATATATAPAPEMRSKRARKDTMVRTIRVDFDQSGDLSVLVSCHIDQQRWAYNMRYDL